MAPSVFCQILPASCSISVISFVLILLLSWDLASVKFRTVHGIVCHYSKRWKTGWIREKWLLSSVRKSWHYANVLAEALLWLQFSKLQERVETAESRVSVLETMIDDLQWDIDKIRKREQRLNRHLADVLERVSTGQETWEWGWCWMGMWRPLWDFAGRAENLLCALVFGSAAWLGISLGLEEISCIFCR